MKDSFGRTIDYLRLSVTELCNLRCRYCMPADGICQKSHHQMLTQEEMLQAITIGASLGIRKLRITGGEPLVKPNILSICEEASLVPGIEEVCITTNGIRLPQMAQALKTAGVSRINLSLDTLTPEKYTYITRTGHLNQALSGLEAALNAGFKKIKINAVLIGGFNDDEIPALASLTTRYPVDVRFIELMPMQEDSFFTPAAYIPYTRVLEALPEAAPAGSQDGVARLYRLPDALGNIGLISPVSAHFCGTCNRIRLTADGNLKPCLHSGDEYNIKGLSYEDMEAQFKKAIWAKPACHEGLSASHKSKAGRDMNQIGG